MNDSNAESENFIITDGVLTEYKGSDEAVIISDGIKEIGRRAFFACSFLKSVKLPDLVKSIEEMTFYCSGLKNIDIPHSVISTGDSAFKDCINLTVSVSKRCECGSNTFYECKKVILR